MRNRADVVEDAEQCPRKTTRGVACARSDGRRRFSFPAGTFTLRQQVVVPPNTVIEGAKNPNDMADPEKKPRMPHDHRWNLGRCVAQRISRRS